MKKQVKSYSLITVGSILYALGTVLFIFPHSLLLGGTSGISVILNTYLNSSPGTILTVINFALLALAFVVLGREMAVKTFIGSTLTTVFVGVTEKISVHTPIVIENTFVSALTGAAIIAVASGVMFYVDSSSGGTDIVALIVKKFTKINIGKALLATDFLIVLAGGAICGWTIGVCSFVGLLVKTSGIDAVISFITNRLVKPDKG